MNNVTLFTGRKKYAQNEPIELEFVEQESLYIQTPQTELAKELKLQKLEKKSLIAQKKVIESLIRENISDASEIYNRFQKINLQPPAAIIYTQPPEFKSQQIENIIKSIGKEFTIDTKPVQNLCNQEILQYYHTVLKDINSKLDYINYSIQLLNKLFNTKGQRNKQLPTPLIFPKVLKGVKKDMSLMNLYKTSRNDIQNLKILLENLAPKIYQEIADLANNHIEKYILENSQEIITYIDGAKLSITEDRAFCALRYLALEAFDKGLINGPDRKVTVKPSDIYKLAGVPYTKDSGYDTKQRLIIKSALTNKKENLLKGIYIQYEQNHKDGIAILSTNFIKHMHWNDEDDQVTYEIDSMYFVNVSDHSNETYWLDDVKGRVGYISTLDQGFKNERQYKLHKYLASCLRKKTPFNVITLLEQSGLINDYKLGKKKSAIKKLQSYLEGMYEYGTLIKNKPIKVPSKSDPEGKYELERI